MISPAFAQSSGAGGGGMDFSFVFVMVAMFAIFYLLTIRPQQKKMKEHQAKLDAIKRGDTVVTTGGIVGKVVRVANDGELRVEIAENVQVRMLKSGVADVRGKTEPVKAKAETQSGGDTGGEQSGA
jgi:preprotein translocase subunit YajC